MDIENFPTDPTALRMMSMISQIYGKSYVGKWIFEVMGTEVGTASDNFKKVIQESFPDTAEEMLDVWEELYGILTKPELSISERRAAVLLKRNVHKSMNPARIAERIGTLTGTAVSVRENTAPHTYEVCVSIEGSDVDYAAVRKEVDKIKQSNKTVDVIVAQPIRLRISTELTYYIGKRICASDETKTVVYPTGANIRRL